MITCSQGFSESELGSSVAWSSPCSHNVKFCSGQIVGLGLFI